MRPWLDALMVFLLVASCHMWMLDGSPLGSRESLRVATARGIVDHWDHWHRWVVPYLYDRPYSPKAPLYHWVLSWAEISFGWGSEWVWRLPSVAASAALGAVLALVAGAWFGEKARRVTGVCYLGLVPLWGYAKSADVDAMNALAAVGAVCALIQVLREQRRDRRILWSLVGTACLAASLLLEATEALPVVLGLAIGTSLSGEVRPRLRNFWFWAAPVFAGLLFVSLWIVPLLRAIRIHAISMDSSGMEAVERQLGFHDWMQPGQAVLVPFVVLLATLPLGLSLFLGISSLRARLDTRERLTVQAVVGTFLMALVLGIPMGITGPWRHQVAIPLLALLGGLSYRMWREDMLPRLWRQIFRVAVIVWITGFCLAHVVVTARLEGGRLQAPMLLTTLIGSLGWCALAWWDSVFRARPQLGLWPAVVCTALFTFPMACFQRQERNRMSSVPAARLVESTIGMGSQVSARDLVATHSDLFVYSRVRPRTFRLWEMDQGVLAQDGWLILSPREADQWRSIAKGHLVDIMELPVPGLPGCRLMWYTLAGVKQP